MKKCKRLLCLTLAVVLACAALCVPVSAQESKTMVVGQTQTEHGLLVAYGESITPYSANLGAVTATVSRQSNGLLCFTGTANARATYYYTVTTTVQKLVSNDWMDMKSENSTVHGPATISVPVPDYISTGGSYRCKVTVEVRNIAGTLQEPITTAYSTTYSA